MQSQQKSMKFLAGPCQKEKYQTRPHVSTWVCKEVKHPFTSSQAVKKAEDENDTVLATVDAETQLTSTDYMHVVTKVEDNSQT